MTLSLVGTVISGRYRIDALMSETSTGAMFRGEHVLMHKRIAVKVCSPAAAGRPDVLARFEREAIAGAHVDHPGVAAAKDFGALEDGSHFLVMEYLDGPTLRQALAAGPLPLDRALKIIRQIALALDAAHAKGIVHRALRPENIHLITRAGETDVVKVVDFGQAKLPPELIATAAGQPGRADRIATPIATPAAVAYAAPELVMEREVDERADLYALGVILYEVVGGSRPALQRGAGAPRLTTRSGVIPVELDALARRLCDEDPARRAGSAIEVVEVIDALGPQSSSRRYLLAVAQPAAEATGATVMSPVRASTTNRRSDSLVGDRDASVPEPSEADARSLTARIAKTPRPILLAAGGAFATVLLIVAAIGLRAPFPADEADAQPSSSSSALAGAPTTRATARATAADTARPAQDDPGPDLGQREVWTRLTKEISSGQFKSAVGSLERLLELDPNAPKDREVRSAIVELAMRVMLVEGPEPDHMFELIESKMGTVGPDILYELVATKGGSRASKRADALLRDKSVRERGTPAMRIAYDLRTVKKCDDKIALLERAKDEGDARSYGALQMMNRDCRRSDQCCLSKDPRLKEAMDAIKDRIR